MAAMYGVELTQEVRPPVQDATLGVDVPAPRKRNWAHRLVAVGDSLTHGFQHFAIFNTGSSWPALVAEQLGVRLQVPADNGPGGTPLNLERTLRTFRGGWFEDLLGVREYALEVKRYYTEGPGSRPPDPHGPRNENLAIWGWDLRDALSRTADHEAAAIRPPGHLSPLVNDAGQRAAVAVLNSARSDDGESLTPLGAARRLGQDDGGIETLCVWLGANNVLGTVLSLDPRQVPPGNDDYTDLEAKRRYNLWTVEAFAAELRRVADRVREVDADHVLWGTVPHVTIPPVTHGLGGQLEACPRYFRYYARLWETEQSFHPHHDRHLTGEQAWAIDVVIDGYNRAVEDVVRAGRQEGRDWRLVDMCAVLDRLAYRRNVELGQRPGGFEPYPLPAALVDLDTRFFTLDEHGNRATGGIIGLDGVHPTTCGYGIVAQEFATAMADAGVEFEHGPELDFAAIRARDTLVSDPPPRLDDALAVIRGLDRFVDLVQRLDPFATDTADG